MADKDAGGNPRRAIPWSDDPSRPSTDTPRPSRARRSLEPWPAAEGDQDATGAEPTGADRSQTPAPRAGSTQDRRTTADAAAQDTPDAQPTVTIQPASTPARDAEITAAAPASYAESQPAEPNPWGRPGTVPADPRPVSSQTQHQRSASSPPPMWQEPHRHQLDRRTRMGLLVSALALVMVTSLAIGFAVWANQPPQVTAPPVGTTPTPSPVAPLNTTSMLTDREADAISPEAGWKISLDEEGIAEDAPQPVCLLRTEPGLPTPEMSRLRTLTTASEAETAVLHQADLYPTEADAQRVFESRLAQLAGCPRQPVFMAEGWKVDGLGDQAAGGLAVIEDEPNTFHSVVLVRTGRLVNVLDAAQQDGSVRSDGLVEAATDVVTGQCGAVDGACADDVTVTKGLPPLGDSEPGFLAPVDVPRITRGAGEWGPTAVETDFTDVALSRCEGIDPATVSGPETRGKVTYLLQRDPDAPSQFGFDEVVLSMEDAEAATALVDDYEESVEGCEEELRTADVSEPQPIEGSVGKSKIAGTAYTVTQSTGADEEVSYRIAMASVDEKVVYLGLPLDPEAADFDFSDEQWTELAERAAGRTTQAG
ncbi:hypothetical protein DT076_13305 [Desertihabitans brevis]|uniref:Uncharacterized protein n=1 Tax=Desertihabitans brevis TaxID=2268447 RepID=A0A367YT23_9ACTN|nr:hypothetical protein [Desertihabitans brevis]RCK68897.1 hypothetical protein DT076_13305 [Desertihabitans brevis]